MRQPLVFAVMLVLFVQVCGGAAVAVEAPGADAEQHLAEIESIYAEAVASKRIRLAPADGHPSLLLSDLPRHVEAVRRSLQQLATEPEVSAGPSPAVIAWYEAHRLRAIPPLAADAKAPCENGSYRPGEPICLAMEPEVGGRLADAIDGLISALPALPKDRRSLGSVPPHELTIPAALREAVLIFEVAAHADDRTIREWSLYPASPLDDEEAGPHLETIREQLYEVASRAAFMRFAAELEESLRRVIHTVTATDALPGPERSRIVLRLRVVKMLVEHSMQWSEC